MMQKHPNQTKRGPLGRPPLTAEQQDRVRHRIVKIAARLFRHEGLKAVSMRRIAREAQVSTMSLYDYFRSKNEIIRAMWERFFSQCFDEVEHAALEGARKGTRSQLEAACAAYVNYWIGHPDEYRAVFLIEDTVEDEERYFVDTSSIMTRYLIFSELLMAHHGYAKEGAAEHPLRNRAQALVCALNGVCHMLITVSEYPWPPAERIVGEILRMA
ncbi:MAG: TetR/AcrR family transcriptional regulator [Steroidobacteraceae bacterium]